MIVALLIAAAPVSSVIDAEYDFARDAQRMGQWTAFRKWADRDAVMFDPQAVWARDYLKDKKDPERSVRWWPARSIQSCDGRTAVNTGPWIMGGVKSHGYFTTVWQREKGEWRWVYDGGSEQTGPMPAPPKPVVNRASCSGKAPGAPVVPPPPLTPREAMKTPEDNGRGQSADKTLGWDWKVDKKGGRIFRVYLWGGRGYSQVLYNDVPPE